MTNKLSYPGLKCVLEYLEANLRIHITARSPALRKIEKSIPIHLEFLMFSDNIGLNDMQMRVFYNNQIMFRRGENEYRRPYPMDLEIEKAVDMLEDYYLGGRMNIYANHFWVFNREVDSFPKFNATTNKMTVYEFLLGDILQYINPNSFPLKQLSIDCIDDLNHPHICSAKKLCIELSEEQNFEDPTKINSIQNKDVELIYDFLERTNVEGIIRHWMENGKETGTTFAFRGRDGDPTNEIVTDLRNEFSEISSELTGVNDQYPNGTPGFSIPLTSSSKILVYGRRNSERFSNEELVLNVVSSQADDSTMEMEH
ncbi:hypothetical protein GCK72_000483 [Caenorhabditis remanei]|uniref:F-box associated domain-containing protein n=1 Tax=Caenorhabditis remanei TaxID=31234 RepID=A0A6A5HKG7_CAERE|nr:hypothetical protein GCK72_000483 [Caenorhabditis remanei]KAF1768670.1 hypothetical protein GCK72_000483 [Caenorhabditis remanei]